jgi:hypothetical protein
MIEELKKLGYSNIGLDIDNSNVLKFFRDKYGLYSSIVPEFYRDGINFTWQVLWYLPKREWTEDIINDGTMMYGDNGECPNFECAEIECINKMIEITNNNIKKVMDFALEVFNNEQEKLNHWMEGPKIAFGGVSPRMLIEQGKIDDLYQFLYRIEHSIYC